MRTQSNAGMSTKDAKAFQKSIRSGLAKTLEDTYRKKLQEIGDELKRQRSECSQEAQQVQERLDQAVTAEKLALAQAKADKSKAREAEAAAKHRLSVAKDNLRAKTTHKRKSCKIEAEAIKERKAAEQAHHVELRRLESYTKRRDKPLSTSRERLSEKRDEVENNIPDELVPLWHKVRRSFHLPQRTEGRMSLTEAFLHYAEEHPEAALDAREDAAEAALKRELRQRLRGEKAAERNRVPF